MPSIPIIGTCFTTPAEFLAYLEGLRFGAWRPKFVTMHHTGAPSLATWQEWQRRAKPVSDEQWLRNLAAYYGGLGWSAGPHFFVTPKHICVLSDPVKRGVHAVSFNAMSWGVEVVGDFDRERLAGDYKDFVASALAAMFLALDAKPQPYRFRDCGLHFHRDDPKTKKTCPGQSIRKDAMIDVIEDAMRDLLGARDADPEDPEDTVKPIPSAIVGRPGKVISPDSLNIRADASAKSPVVGTLAPGATIAIKGKAMNGATEWLAVDAPDDADGRGWVAARYVQLT
jgi:hypothetical protein